MNKFLGTALLGGALLATVAVAAPAADDAKMGTKASPAAAKLHSDMRKLWTDHVVWTRDYIIAAVGDQPDLKAATDRLMKNQKDIASAVATYYGQPAGTQLQKLLEEHITTAADVVKAAKASDNAGLQKADQAWHKNAEAIADFLSKANPQHWPRATLVDMMNKHLSTTTDEVTARIKKDWDGDVKAFDAVYDHILHMSDTLADGIVAQYPNKF